MSYLDLLPSDILGTISSLFNEENYYQLKIQNDQLTFYRSLSLPEFISKENTNEFSITCDIFEVKEGWVIGENLARNESLFFQGHNKIIIRNKFLIILFLTEEASKVLIQYLIEKITCDICSKPFNYKINNGFEFECLTINSENACDQINYSLKSGRIHYECQSYFSCSKCSAYLCEKCVHTCDICHSSTCSRCYCGKECNECHGKFCESEKLTTDYQTGIFQPTKTHCFLCRLDNKFCVRCKNKIDYRVNGKLRFHHYCYICDKLFCYNCRQWHKSFSTDYLGNSIWFCDDCVNWTFRICYICFQLKPQYDMYSCSECLYRYICLDCLIKCPCNDKYCKNGYCKKCLIPTTIYVGKECSLKFEKFNKEHNLV